MGNNFEKMLTVDMRKYIHEKQRQKYISWTYAWQEFKRIYPDANYGVIYTEDGLPYKATPLGIMVRTEVTANGETIPMHLPVMNGAMKSMKEVPYEYMTKQGKKVVEAATMTDINKAIMRCLAKNIAMFGLGLFVFNGEDFPAPELVGSAELQAIMDKIKEKGIPLNKVLKAWQLDKIAKLHLGNFDNMMKFLDEYKG